MINVAGSVGNNLTKVSTMRMSSTSGFIAALFALMASLGAQAQYQFTEEFESFPLPTGADAWIAQFANGGGGYNDGDVGGLGMDYSTPSGSTIVANGGYLNFYARYDDTGILQTSIFRNLGGFAGGDPFSANNGDHTLTACVYVPAVADFGADFDAGVDAGMGVRISGLGYSQWPGDLNFNASVSVSSLPREVWTRVNLDFTVTDGSRVDAGVWVTNPAMPPTVNTGVYYDDMWLGFAADAPTTACAGATTGGGGSGGGAGTPASIPTMPLWGLIGLAGLLGLMGYRRKK